MFTWDDLFTTLHGDYSINDILEFPIDIVTSLQCEKIPWTWSVILSGGFGPKYKFLGAKKGP